MTRGEGGVQRRRNQQFHQSIHRKGTDTSDQGFEDHVAADKIQHQADSHGRAVLPLVFDEKQHHRQDDPQLSVVGGPADDRQHRVQKSAAKVRLYPIQCRKFRHLHGTSPPIEQHMFYYTIDASEFPPLFQSDSKKLRTASEAQEAGKPVSGLSSGMVWYIMTPSCAGRCAPYTRKGRRSGRSQCLPLSTAGHPGTKGTIRS